MKKTTSLFSRVLDITLRVLSGSAAVLTGWAAYQCFTVYNTIPTIIFASLTVLSINNMLRRSS